MKINFRDYIKYRRHGIVVILLLFTIYVNGNWGQDINSEKEDVKQDKSISSFSPLWKDKDHADIVLSQSQPSQKKDDFFDVNPGDIMRLSFVATSTTDQDVSFSVGLLNGHEKKIGTIHVISSLRSRFYETFFIADDFYKDIIFTTTADKKLQDNSKNSDTGFSVIVSDLSSHRLNVNSLAEAKSLIPTVFGTTDFISVPLQTKESRFPQEGITLRKDNKFVTYEFVADSTALAFIDFSGVIIGTGGSGKYEFLLLEKKGDQFEKVKSKKISAEGFKKWQRDEGSYRLYFPEFLEEGKSYTLKISSVDVNTDANNYFLLKKTPELITGHYIMDGGKRVLTGASIFDVGGVIVYEYSMRHSSSDLYDLTFLSDDIQYDWYSGNLIGSGNKGSYFEYQFDLPKNISRFSVSAKSLSELKDHMSLQYSFDRTSWKDLAYKQEKEQIFSDNILSTPDTLSQKTVYIKAAYLRNDDDKDIKKWGLADFNFKAYMVY